MSDDQLRALDAQWRAANYLTVGQIYLLDNPLLTKPLQSEHIKPRLLGHWGTSPGLNFVYAHMNRAIIAHDINALFVVGPGHGGPAMFANTWLEGSYSDVRPDIPQNVDGMRILFREFSFPGGVPSHVAPEVPGSIHEGGELGYSLAHAYGAVLDNPDLVAVCVVGDGEAETGPLAASWHANKFLNPATDGVVLPILHLNGYKIANPTVLSRITDEELEDLLRGYGYSPIYVSGHEPVDMHQQMAAALDRAIMEIRDLQLLSRCEGASLHRAAWPMIVLRTPKGWTGPATVDGVQVEGTWRSHQVPVGDVRENAGHRALLDEWMRSYRPEELFDDCGAPNSTVKQLIPSGHRRMGSNPHTNGGAVLKPLVLPDPGTFGVVTGQPGGVPASPTRILGRYLRELMVYNARQRNFRLFGPDETESNKLGDVFDVTDKQWSATILPTDNHLGRDGRVLEVLSEHLCQGWLEGYLLTGRHGLFSCYEAFTHIVDSMVNQHAKWLKVSRQTPWRRPIASLNYLLTSHVWRQDHNGFSHQDPGFIDHVANKRAEVARIYLPPDANTLLSVAAHCLASRDYINVIVAGKNYTPVWLNPEQAALHCARGADIFEWASSDAGSVPDVVLACAGDVPTIEVLAAVSILRKRLPQLKIRVGNIVDLFRLQSDSQHPHGMTDTEYNTLFTKESPVIFAFHGYPSLIHKLTYRRAGHANMHVRGYLEEGTTTTPFDMLVLNKMDRFQLVIDVLERTPRLRGDESAGQLREDMHAMHARHHDWIRTHGEDLPEVRHWRWEGAPT
ncbi:putative phosphoketolase [Mycobacteroides abscessus 5S-0422]|uniref:Probable phosphoketolase n=1 Tax=Mycobacteroides abscessus subsp. bolletii 1513 TaxID=1299321 RepID=X8DN62_9MYCO|nr:putative phosphoketolase [Mycobacteroides abscessus 5S-0304]EIU14229.1 putative phosphoketolase [Mycobacteroides abscessus 5S-0421]EIU15043.1 putative phosphoketolase [Mycobacteroides abscessus 5S-0422]EIU26895.1 putative phosphoketolase [Mycobacteroides abscessus 5S-0708]EIU27320.1 putative phosphoketolase [Mycobacteroides abscessus 5S-0817]EIU29250.1 putative phosphoketolase [Mycobacteroides abscessus 5S-1212]EIU50185.1 putative phosphoketolase [Mycobacteroides abscessus 5S-1215]EIU9325